MTKQQIKTGAASLLVGVLAPMALIVPSVSAASITWTGTTDDFFMESTNWTGGVIPGALDTAVFNSSSLVQNVTVPAGAGSVSLGGIRFEGEVSGPSSKSYTITGGALSLTSAIEAAMTGSGGEHSVKNSIILADNLTFSTSGVNTLQVGEDGTTLDLGTNDLTLQPDGGTITLAGEIDGSGKIIVNGDKTVNMLAKPATGYSGAVELAKGVLEINSDTEGNFIINGGTLMGSSEFLGTVSMSSGKIAPGYSPGCISVDSLTFTGGTYSVEVKGSDPCTGYDQITSLGAVDLGSATTLELPDLSFLDGYEESDLPASFAIILNDDSGPVQGEFTNFPNGEKQTLGDYTVQVNYDAGDGNDVLMLVTGTPSAPDTGISSVLTSPLAAVAATFAALSVLGGLKFAEQRRK